MTFTLSNAYDLFIVFVGVLLLFRRVVQIESYHTLRVFLITAVLSVGVIFFFLLYGFTLGNPTPIDYCSDPGQFCLTE
jgi:hypothetical protein